MQRAGRVSRRADFGSHLDGGEELPGAPDTARKAASPGFGGREPSSQSEDEGFYMPGTEQG